MPGYHYGERAQRIAAMAAIKAIRQVEVLMEEWGDEPREGLYIEAQELRRRLMQGDREGVMQAIPHVMRQIASQGGEGAE